MRLIHKSTSKRNVAQRHLGLKHVLGGQVDATADYEGVGGVTEGAPKGARKVRFAAQYQSAKICDQNASGDVPLDVVHHLPNLPWQQTFFSIIRGSCRRLWINLPSQQRGCLEYRTVRGLFLVKLRDGRIQQRQDIVHPITRSALTNFRTGLRSACLSFAGLSLHFDAASC